MVYKKTVFKPISVLHDTLIFKGVNETTGEPYSQYTKRSFIYLINSVKTAKWLRSETYRFTFVNFDMNSDELTRLWNVTHDKKLTSSRFRGIQRQASDLFESLFGSISSFEEAFYTEDSERIAEFVIRVELLNSDDLTLGALLEAFVRTECSLPNTDKSFSFEDCKREIDFLARNSSLALSQSVAELDAERLSFVYSILSSKLVNYSTGSINEKKYELLRMIYLTCKEPISTHVVFRADDILKSHSVVVPESTSKVQVETEKTDVSQDVVDGKGICSEDSSDTELLEDLNVGYNSLVKSILEDEEYSGGFVTDAKFLSGLLLLQSPSVIRSLLSCFSKEVLDKLLDEKYSEAIESQILKYTDCLKDETVCKDILEFLGGLNGIFVKNEK